MQFLEYLYDYYFFKYISDCLFSWYVHKLQKEQKANKHSCFKKKNATQ